MKTGQLILSFVFCVLVTKSVSEAEYSISTDPQRQPGDSEVYVAGIEDAVNVTIYCNITSTTNGEVMPQWKLINDSMEANLSLFSNDGVSSEFPFISFPNNVRQILVISIFNSDVNGLQLECEGGDVSETFLYSFRGIVIATKFIILLLIL